MPNDDALSSAPLRERVSVPEEQTFLWRMDDYPWKGSVWNLHPEFEIHLIRHSTGTAYVGDHVGRFEPGHLVLTGCELPHDWMTPLPDGRTISERDIVVQFDPGLLDQAGLKLPELARLQALFSKAARGLEFFGETAVGGARLLEAMGKVGHLARLGMLLELLALLSDSTEYRTLATAAFVANEPPVTTTNVPWVEEMLDRIRREHTFGLMQKDLAAASGMSCSTFSRLFKAHVGHTFSEHLERLRIRTACRLLAETELSVTTVCFESGYGNVSMFNRAFLRGTRTTPSEYRRAAHSRTPGAGAGRVRVPG